MRGSFSPAAFFVLFGIAILFLVWIQILVYRALKSILVHNRQQKRYLQVLLALANLPQAMLMASYILGKWGQIPFAIKASASVHLVLSMLFLVFYGLLKGLLWLYEQASGGQRNPHASQEANFPEPRVSLESRRRFLRRAVAGFGGAAALGTFHGIYLARGEPQLEFVDLRHPEWPKALDGFTIVQLSDFHAGPYMSRDDLLRIREATERLGADMIVLTGDFADSHPDQVPDIVAALHHLEAPYGVFSILGNHDYYAGVQAVRQGLAEAGLPLLVNAHLLVSVDGETIAVVGLDDRWARRWGRGEGPDIRKAMDGIPAGQFRICLSHQPQLWPVCVRHGMHLTLSGHTHGGQIGIPYTQLNLARLATPYVAGLYRNGSHWLYVNRGLGTVGLPVRIGVPPEITFFRLRAGNPKAS